MFCVKNQGICSSVVYIFGTAVEIILEFSDISNALDPQFKIGETIPLTLKLKNAWKINLIRR